MEQRNCFAVNFLVWILSFQCCSTVLTLNEVTTVVGIDDVQFHLCEPPKVKNAKLSENREHYLEGERAEVMCDEGYRVQFIRSNSMHLICSMDGTWHNYLGQPDLPTCQRIGGCPTVNISHMVVMENSHGFMPGDVIPVICDPGYEPTISGHLAKLMCQKDGTWGTQDGSPLPKCKVLTCIIPTEFPHGSIKIEVNSKLSHIEMFPEKVPDSSIIEYSCVDGYVLDDQHKQQLKCTHGAWNASPPTCVKQTEYPGCHVPPQINHASSQVNPIQGTIIEGNILPEGTRVTYKCNEGYISVSAETHNAMIVCLGGKWKGPLMTCIMFARSCESPPLIAYGDFMSSASTTNVSRGQMYSDGVKVYYYCDNGYRLRNTSFSSLQCVDGEWHGSIPKCERRTHCDRPMDIPDGNWLIGMYLPNYPIGTKVTYECHNGYKSIGTTHIECLPTGYWSDYAPRCLAANNYCSEPGPVDNGVYMCRPSHCDLFKIGTEVHYVCNKDYQPRQDDVMVQKCMNGGIWSGQKPECNREELAAVTDTLHFNTSTLTVVIATSCGVLGLLVIVMVVVALQRRHKPRSSRLCHPSTPPPPPYPSPPTGLVDEPDRVALIAFADGVQVVLPSYDEAIRGRPTSRLSRYNSDSTRGSIRSSSSRGDYRPLPSLPPSLRNGGPQIREIPPDHHRDHHRNSIITTTSITTRDNLSLTLGSLDTVNISDGTSTSVTVDTASSNFSIATSQRAAAGSIDSSSTNGSIQTEDAPLLDQNHYNSETMRSHHSSHSNTSDTLMANTQRCQCTDRSGYDALQSSRSQSESSAIVEVPEEQKEG